MVRIILLILVQTIFAASGDYAYQAKKYFSQGRYEAAYGQYELALKEAKKEADLVAEGRILTSMATLATHAMEYEEAKKIFEKVRINSLDEKSKEDFYKAYMEFYNLQGEYRRAFEIANKNSFKKASAAFLGEVAVAAAGSKNNGEADSHIKKISKCNSPGQLAFYKAKVADLKGENSRELYENALKLSVEKKQYFTSATILLRLAQITGNKDYAARSASVFSELGLAKPFQKANEAVNEL
jgi:tetratricopeptide (TPR) repeat protein